MTQHNTGSFTTPDGLSIYTQNWLPADEPKAIVLIAHGLGEHSDRYVHVGNALTQRGYGVYTLDHRGHGRSEGLRVYFDNFQNPVDDLKLYFDSIRAQHPGKDIFLYGHSMGSLISLYFTLRYQSELAGLIISGTPLTIDQPYPQFALKALGFLDTRFPQMPLAALSARGVSRDKAIVTAYEKDPLVANSRVRVRMTYQMASSARELRGKVQDITLPLLVLHGTADPICPVSGGKLLYQTVQSPDKTLKLYEGLYHEVHNEPEQETVLADVGKWLESRT